MPPSARPPIPSLTGLRFIAAFAIVMNHLGPVLFNVGPSIPFQWNFQRLALVGMSLFFVLSGFIIHYNYAQQVSTLKKSALFDFFIARFSRLYPLYILVLAFDFFAANLFISSSPVERQHYISLLPYYLAAVQSWFFMEIGGHSLPFAFRYSIVSWSISTEFFLYLIYPICSVFLVRARTVRAAGITCAVVTVVSVALVYYMRKRYNVIDGLAERFLGLDPNMKSSPPMVFSDWLSYISPYGRLPEFITGCAISQFCVVARGYKPSRIETVGATVVFGATLMLLCATLSAEALKHVPYSKDVQWAGMFPIMVITVFVCGRYDNLFSRALSHDGLVTCGDASYSIYMMHVFFIQAFAIVPGTEATTTNVAILLVRSVLVTAFIIVAALGCYRYFEVPARKLIRSRLTPQHRDHAPSTAATRVIAPA